MFGGHVMDNGTGAGTVVGVCVVVVDAVVVASVVVVVVVVVLRGASVGGPGGGWYSNKTFPLARGVNVKESAVKTMTALNKMVGIKTT